MSAYFDYAAATPVDAKVLAAMLPFFSEQFYNPSALYTPSVEVKQAIERARQSIAHELGAKPIEIYFTGGGTEANNLAIHGVMQQFPDAHMVVSAIEHDSVRFPAQQYQHAEAAVNHDGVVEPGTIVGAVQDNTVLVSVMYANNEVGSVQPIRRIAAELDAIRRERQKTGNTLPLYLHTDAAQAGNYLDLHVHRLGVDLLTLNGGKLYGPKQSGVLFVRAGVQVAPLVQGGGQERGLRSGTESAAQIVGLAAALKLASELRISEVDRLKKMQQHFITRLQAAIPDAQLNGSLKHRLPNNVHVTLPGTDNERVLIALDMQEIYAAAGSACSASNEEPSHVLAAMGADEATIRGSLRFTMGRGTTQASIDQLVATLAKLVND